MASRIEVDGDDNDSSGHLPPENEVELFSSTGLVRVKIIEAIDILDYLMRQPTFNKKVNKLYYVYTSIAVLRENNILYKYDTMCKPYLSKGSGQLNIGEDFLFHVSSAFSLSISLYAFRKDGSVDVDDKSIVDITCVGTIQVPVSRLGDGDDCKVFCV
jgi:hypothetical protein